MPSAQVEAGDELSELFSRMNQMGLRFTPELGSEPNSPPSTVQSSRSPTPEAMCGDYLLDFYLERFRMRKSILGTHPGLLTGSPRHINDLPVDILMHIVGYLDNAADLMAFMHVQRRWLQLAAAKLWYKPQVTTPAALERLAAVLRLNSPSSSDDDEPRGNKDDDLNHSIIDYAALVHRINLAPAAKHLNDSHLVLFSKCHSIERLVLSSCDGISTDALVTAIRGMPRLQSLDVQDVPAVNDCVFDTLAEYCPELQVLYGGGDEVTDSGLIALAALARTLRRLILSRCTYVTPLGAVKLVSLCRNLVELDLTGLSCFKNDLPVAFYLINRNDNQENVQGGIQDSPQRPPVSPPPSRTAPESDEQQDQQYQNQPQHQHQHQHQHQPTQMAAAAAARRAAASAAGLSNAAASEDTATASAVETGEDSGSPDFRERPPATEQAALALTSAPQQPTATSFPDGPGLSNEHVQQIFIGCPGLRDLRLDNSSRISAAAFDLSGTRRFGTVMPRMDSLRVLSLAMCSQLNDSALSQLVRSVPRIRHLNLSKCPLITDRGVCTIADAYGSGLHYLHLGHCTKITDRAVSHIAEKCPRLSFFDAANCSNLTNVSLMALARLPKLRRIGVVKCNEIGAPGVMALAQPQRTSNGEIERPIERLHLSYCSSISIRAVNMVLEACPRLVHLSLTGVREFMRADIMRLSRPPPPELNEHQRQVFCVFSGSGIAELREALKTFYELPGPNLWISSPVFTQPQPTEAPGASSVGGASPEQNRGGLTRREQQEIEAQMLQFAMDLREEEGWGDEQHPNNALGLLEGMNNASNQEVESRDQQDRTDRPFLNNLFQSIWPLQRMQQQMQERQRSELRREREAYRLDRTEAFHIGSSENTRIPGARREGNNHVTIGGNSVLISAAELRSQLIEVDRFRLLGDLGRLDLGLSESPDLERAEPESSPPNAPPDRSRLDRRSGLRRPFPRRA